MIYGLYAYKNNKLGCFSTPKFEVDDDARQVELVRRAIKGSNHEDLKLVRNSDFYRIGTYDDLTGELKTEVILLLNIDELLSDLEVKL